jgi:cell division protein FtsB
VRIFTVALRSFQSFWFANLAPLHYHAPALGKKTMALLPPRPAKYKGRLAVCVGLLLLFAVAAVYGDHGLLHLLRLHGEQRELEGVVFQLQQHNEHLRQRIRHLQADDRYIEKLARERLGLVKPGEIIYRAAAPKAAPPSRE